MVAPGRNNWNMALFKAFQFKENARFEFRAETFNTFNHTQFNGLNNGLSTSVTAPDFGQLKSEGSSTAPICVSSPARSNGSFPDTVTDPISSDRHVLRLSFDADETKTLLDASDSG